MTGEDKDEEEGRDEGEKLEAVEVRDRCTGVTAKDDQHSPVFLTGSLHLSSPEATCSFLSFPVLSLLFFLQLW